MISALSFDIEDYFHGEAFQNICSSEKLSLKQRVVNNTNTLLNILKERNIKATFFVLGIVAEEHPELVRRIYSDGHEIGLHGYDHVPIYRYRSSTQFENDLRKSKKIIEDIIAQAIRGYRAPNFSIRNDTLWALEIIRSVGFQYDSSVFPVYHDRYGIPSAPIKPYEIIPGLVEIPLNVCKLFDNLRIPFGGGGYFRLYPYFITNILAYINNQNGQASIFYFHPHDFDESQPLQVLKLISRWRRQIGLRQNKQKFIRLLSNYKFITIGQMVDQYKNIMSLS
jgi:polysaccharide deacetylase family protein (PEP-CTERM system associated)